MGTPCLLRGVADVAAFSGYSFGLLQKSNSPAVREPQGLTNNELSKLEKDNENSVESETHANNPRT